MSLVKILNEKTKSLGTLVDKGNSNDTHFVRSFQSGDVYGKLSVNVKEAGDAKFLLFKGEKNHEIFVKDAPNFIKDFPDFISDDEAKKLNKIFVPIVNRLTGTPKIAKFL
ncbi:hypothetical protein EN12_21980 [Vibrio cholerae]|nr:hypothetical protein EN12_21980 [Vibrio cholerae]